MRRFLNLTTNIVLSNVRELRTPYKLTYAITYRCQFKCSICKIWQKGALHELTLEEISDFFKKSSGFSWINLTGGEIFLREDLLEIIDAINKYCKGVYLLNFPTNGYETEVVVDTVKKILNSFNFSKVLVTVSLDGPPPLHDQIRNMPGSWNRSVETFQRLRRLRSSHFDVFFGMTLQDTNANAFGKTVDTVRERIKTVNYNDFHVNVMHHSEFYYGNANCSGISDVQQILMALGRIQKLRSGSIFNPVGFLERRYQKMVDYYLTTKKSPVSCQALSASIFMDPTGMVYPCTVFNKPIGSIIDNGFDIHSLWGSDKKRNVRQEVREGNCPHCWTPCEAYQNILANLLPLYKR